VTALAKMVFSSDVPAETPSIWPTATVATAAAEQPRTLAGRRYRTGADAATADAKSGSTPGCANMVDVPIWQLNS
jgi:hypothetical protein